MDEAGHIISEASKKIDVEAHVLRNWEDELVLKISRNKLGHRYYKDIDIELLQIVKELRGKGYQLKAIKILLSNLGILDSLDYQKLEKLKEEVNGKVINIRNDEIISENENGTSLISSDEKQEIKEHPNVKMEQFKAVMNDIILSALKENNTLLSEEIGTNVTDGVIKEMSYLMRLQEEKEEERYKKFDATLRDYQRSRTMAAAALDGKNKKRSKFLKKNKIYI